MKFYQNICNFHNFKEKNKLIKPIKNQEKRTPKHFPSSVREWNNSIYVYNKNSLNLIPSTTLLVTNMIKSYFNLYNKRLELKMRTKRLLLRLRRLSSNKYYISNGGFKHTNNKVYINLYVFNRQKKNYLSTLKKWYLKMNLTFWGITNELLLLQVNPMVKEFTFMFGFGSNGFFVTNTPLFR